MFAPRSHQREQILDQPGLLLQGKVGDLGAEGAGGGTSGRPPPPRGLQWAPMSSLRHPQGQRSLSSWNGQLMTFTRSDLCVPAGEGCVCTWPSLWGDLVSG